MENTIFNNAKKLGFGLMRLPTKTPDNPANIDIEQVKQMVDMFIERGFTYFDTAWMYCGFASENAAKEALVDRYPRNSFTLATKLHAGFIKTEEDCDKIFNEQLKKTGVAFFDYYLIHDVNRHNNETYNKLHVFDWLLKKKSAGLVKHIGFSFHDDHEFLEHVLSEHPEVEFVQIQLNYLDYDNPSVQSRKCYEVATKHNVPVIVMEPVKGGTLVNMSETIVRLYKDFAPELSVASWAIRFAASHKNVAMVLSGMSNLAQLDDNTSYMKEFKPLSEEEQLIVKKATAILNEETVIPCTGCSYCTEGCPMHIAIPRYFALYNADLKENPNGTKPWTIQGEYYANLTKTFGKASECVQCGQCEDICPQHIKIIGYLQDVSKRFETA